MQCCRICLGSSDLTNIFSTENTAQQICSFASVQLQEHDELPQYICLLCKHELDICVNFKEKCETTYEILKKKKANVHRNNNVLINLIDNKEQFLKSLPDIANEVYECVKENTRNKLTAVVKKEDLEETSLPNELARNFQSGDFDDCKYSTITENNSYIENCCINPTKKTNECIESISVFGMHQEKSLDHEGDSVEPVSTESEDFSSEDWWSEDHYQMEETFDEKMDVLCQENEDIMCMLCNFYFKDEEALKSHFDRIHRNTKEQCQICLCEFPNRSVFSIHLKKRHDITVESDTSVFKCRICYKMFFQQADLNLHTCNPSQLAFKCMSCERSFLTESILKRHIQNSHVSHCFNCKYCGATFNVHDKLVSHLRSHNKEYIKCDLCSKYLKNNACLKVHQKLHFENKEYLCEKCYKKYLTKWDLRRHIKTVHENGGENHVI